MLKWIRGKLRQWLLESDTESPSVLDVLIDGDLKRVAVVGVIGTGVLVSDGRTQRLVFESQCADPEKFRQVLRKHGPKMHWEDGDPYLP